jgi:predicted amidohydrolase YtcJ
MDQPILGKYMKLIRQMSLVALISFSILSCSSISKNNIEESADLIITGAKIFTSDKEQPWAQALVVKEGKFIYVGDSSGTSIYKSSNTRSINLNGKLVISGLTDGHSHPGYVNVENFGEVEGDNIEDLLASVKAYADEHPDDEWLRLCCWSTDMFVEGNQGPKKEVLDAVVPDRLVWFESATAHDFWLNSKAFEKLGVDKNTPDPRPGLAMYARDEDGEPSGWVKEGAGVQHFAKQFALTDDTREQKHKESVAKTLQILSEYGVTSIFDAGNKGYGDLAYSVVSQLEKEGKLPVRYYGTYQIFVPERAKTAISEIKRYRKEYGGELLQFNSVKLFMDGISANQSAAYSEPYVGNPGSEGTTMLSVEELRDLLLELNTEKLDLLVHTIGDLAVKTVLAAVEAAQAIVKDDFYPRVTMSHLVLIDPSDIPRIKKLGVICNFTPWWIGVDVDVVVEDLLGEERYSKTYQTKTMFDSGAVVTFSSDEWWGGEMLAAYINPYIGMQVGHTRQYPKEWWVTEEDGIRAPVNERLSLEQLIEGYTRNGAYQLRMENEVGSIEKGKLADFIVLEKNIFEVDRYEIGKVKPSAVVMEGKVIQGALPE